MGFDFNNLIRTIITIIVLFVIYEIISYALNKSKGAVRAKSLMSSSGSTYATIIKSALRFIYILISILVILQVNGINVSGMLAGVGIASAIIGLAVQDVLKDIIRGLSIISDKYFNVGDVIKIDDNTGIVLTLGIRSTKIKDIYTDNIVSIANRNIEKVEVVSKTINLNIPLPYDVSIKKAEKAMEEIVEEVKKIDGVDNSEYRGVTELADSAIEYRLYVSCKPELTISVRRKSLRTVLLVLDKNNIEVPFTQIDIHNKK